MSIIIKNMKKSFTREGLEKLKKRLAFLEKTKRKEVADELKAAASFGDLSENSAYEEAKHEQNMLETEISKIREAIKNAEVVEMDKDSKLVQIGSRIVVETSDGKEEFEIVGGTESDPFAGKISCDSPLGKALIGKKEGESTAVQTPSGEKSYKIVKINE